MSKMAADVRNEPSKANNSSSNCKEGPAVVTADDSTQKRKPLHRSWLDEVKTFSQHIFSSSFEDLFSNIRRIVWIVAVCVCSFFVIKQMTNCLSKLSNPPITTQTRIQMLEHMSYPAITACFKNSDDEGYDEEMLRCYNVSKYWIDEGSYNDYPWEYFPWGQVPMSAIWEDATFSITDFYNLDPTSQLQDDIEIRCPSNGVLMPTKSRIKVVMQVLNQIPATGVKRTFRYMHDHGRCYTFQPPEDAEKPMPGEKLGYKLYFTALEGKYQLLPGGWDLYIHDPLETWAENPFISYSHQERIHVNTGEKAYIRLSESIFNSVNREDDPCVDNLRVSYTECRETCRWSFIAANPNVSCSLPFMKVPGYKECDTFATANLAMNKYREWVNEESDDICKSRCIKRCQTKIYKAQITRHVQQKQDTSIFHIYFPSGIVQDLHEDWGYDMTLFIADFGGSLGFLLGASILSVLEIIEGIVISTYRMLKSKTITMKLEQQLEEARAKLRASGSFRSGSSDLADSTDNRVKGKTTVRKKNKSQEN